MSNTPPELQKTAISAEQREELDTAFAKARAALAIIETYDQERIDRLCQAVAWAVSNKKTFTRLVAEGIAESRLGDPDSRMGKRMKIRGILRDALRQKSVGIIEEIPEKGIVKYGKPAGVVACIVPTTNPDLTPAGNAIYGIKARATLQESWKVMMRLSFASLSNCRAPRWIRSSVNSQMCCGTG
jgi:sulfoacetaldehyde dehydrogenase